MVSHGFDVEVYNAVLDSLKSPTLTDELFEGLWNLGKPTMVCNVFKYLAEPGHLEGFKKGVLLKYMPTAGESSFENGLIDNAAQAVDWMKTHETPKDHIHELVSLLNPSKMFTLFDSGLRTIGEFFNVLSGKDIYENFLIHTRGALRGIDWNRLWMVGPFASILYTNKLNLFPDHMVVLYMNCREESSMHELVKKITRNMSNSATYNFRHGLLIVGFGYPAIRIIRTFSDSIDRMISRCELSMSSIAVSFAGDYQPCVIAKPTFLKTLITGLVTVNPDCLLTHLDVSIFSKAFECGYDLRHLETDIKFTVTYKNGGCDVTVPLAKLSKGDDFMRQAKTPTQSVSHINPSLMTEEQYHTEVEQAFGFNMVRFTSFPIVKVDENSEISKENSFDEDEKDILVIDDIPIGKCTSKHLKEDAQMGDVPPIISLCGERHDVVVFDENPLSAKIPKGADELTWRSIATPRGQFCCAQPLMGLVLSDNPTEAPVFQLRGTTKVRGVHINEDGSGTVAICVNFSNRGKYHNYALMAKHAKIEDPSLKFLWSPTEQISYIYIRIPKENQINPFRPLIKLRDLSGKWHVITAQKDMVSAMTEATDLSVEAWYQFFAIKTSTDVFTVRPYIAELYLIE